MYSNSLVFKVIVIKKAVFDLRKESQNVRGVEYKVEVNVNWVS